MGDMPSAHVNREPSPSWIVWADPHSRIQSDDASPPLTLMWSSDRTWSKWEPIEEHNAPPILKSTIPAAILTSGLFWATVTPSSAKPEYSKTEEKACAFC